ncbi:hypothetical protein F4819DRAFT_365307 [Hypoxylon fuscum]|nr:hypothetical protein F4819DRAFT_365307 [Hypoxylon fuscum]
MLAIVALITLLGFAEASLKTPRTAIFSRPNPSPSPSSTATLVAAFPTATISGNGIHPPHFNGTGYSFPRPTGGADCGTRNTALPLSLNATAHVPTGTAAKAPKITPSPEFDPPGGNFHEIGGGAKFVQTTYWSCVTFPLETHCGWHEPILDAGAARLGCEGGGRAAIRAGVVAGVVAGGLVLGI